ncbi:MAG: hypothetical protein ACI4UE_06825 [Candidatus Scatovivens sp.]
MCVFLIALFSANKQSDEHDGYVAKVWARIGIISIVVLLISIVGIKGIESNYYQEKNLISMSRIVSVEKKHKDTIVICLNEYGDTKTLLIPNKKITIDNKKSHQYIYEYIVYTRCDMNEKLFKFLTFGYLPKEFSSYVIK